MNPLLTESPLPLFKQIQPEHIEPAVDEILAENRASIAALLSSTKPSHWDDIVLPLETLQDRLHKVWAPANHLHAVATTDELRKAYNNCLPKLTTYNTELEQNKDLYKAYEALAKGSEFSKLNAAQQKVITNQLRDFHLAGITLPEKSKQRYAEIQTRLVQLATKFEENVHDATEGWTKHVQNKEELAGVPEHVLQTTKEQAQQKGLPGWILTLEYPCYSPILSYATNRELRRELYTAYATRASDEGPHDKSFDNSSVMAEILALRHELSLLLGFKNFAELSLATKMVKNPDTVLMFLEDLAVQARQKALQELEDLKEFAYQADGLVELQPWDIAYYSEKLCLQHHGIDDEILRPYFPVDTVLKGMFTLTEKLYGMHIVEEKNIETWHPDVKFFTIYDQKNNLRGQFYLDLYARSQKRGGAWMDDCRNRWRNAKGVQTPVAFLTCNLTPPSGDKPALLTHDEVVTIFHEFGHGLHHMLTQVDYSGVSGIRGVEWDAVELPSQFNEFFTWEKPILQFVSGHYQNGEPLPDQLFHNLRAAKHFQAGLRLARQLEFALFDFGLHLNYDPGKGYQQIQTTLNEVRNKVSALKPPPWHRFQHGFSHIFAGGYAAGYYSYLWAEMLASDAYSKFEEHGILNAEIGHEFLTKILEKGGSADALDLFVDFRGRQPNTTALLRHLGLTHS